MSALTQSMGHGIRVLAGIAGDTVGRLVPFQLRGSSFGRRRAAHVRLGRRGETLARGLLRRRGLDVLTRNFRTGRGEVDIVARDHTTLCFVEVKTRRERRGTRPADAVTPRKQQRIIAAAHRYLRELGWPNVSYRYDIVEIVVQGNRLADMRHWPGAFTEQPIAFADLMPRQDGDSDDWN